MSTEAPVSNPARTNKAPLPDPYKDPAGFLLAKGWRCRGEPTSALSRWLDPTRPRKKPEHRKERREVAWRYDEDGQKMEAIKTVEQVVVTPAAEDTPFLRDEAIEVQLERDEAASLAGAKAS